AGRLATADALDDRVHEEQLGEPEDEGAEAGDHVEVGELQRIVGDAPGHAGQAEEVHGEESDVESNGGQPEVPLAQGFVIQVAGPFREPVVDAAHDAHRGAGEQHVVEVGDDVVGV